MWTVLHIFHTETIMVGFLNMYASVEEFPTAVHFW